MALVFAFFSSSFFFLFFFLSFFLSPTNLVFITWNGRRYKRVLGLNASLTRAMLKGLTFGKCVFGESESMYRFIFT